jgi:ribosomal protein L37AE/L43A
VQLVGDLNDCPKSRKREKKEVLNIFREMWSEGDSSLRRMYSSWEELERSVEIASEGTAQEKHRIPCPDCGTKQNVTKPINGIFPYQKCNACKQPFFVNDDLTVRKLTAEEKQEIPKPWIDIVEDLNKKKVAVVFRLI